MTYLPSLQDLGFTIDEWSRPKDPRSCIEFKGGEDEGMKRCKYYIWDSRKIGRYVDTRNGIMGADYSSKLSPWLACGALSPRYVYWETKKYEAKYKANKSTTHFISELFWRDFCHWYCYRHGDRVFYEYGALGKSAPKWKVNQDTIQRWKQGLTGVPLIDALQRELNYSGFMSNRGRQIVASYLALDLK